MASAGAPGLALRLMDGAQPGAADYPGDWAAWERARIRVLADTGAWRRALQRLDERPSNLPRTFDHWAEYQQARCHLELGQAEAARQRLRALLWQRRADAADERVRRWRRAIVRSYLVGGSVEDAVTAMRRFDQDYADPGTAWARLRGRVLLRAGRAHEAARHLAGARLDTPAARALTLLARLRSDARGASAIAQEALSAARADDADAPARARFWFVAAEAAATPAGAALATERAAALSDALSPDDALFRTDGDAVWDAWIAYARWYANEHRLLVGDDEAWFDAVHAAEPGYPVRARALLALAARRGGPAARRRAHEALVARLAESDGGMGLARRVYLDTPYYRETGDVPAQVRYAFVDDALRRDDVALATRLFTDLDEPPPGVDPLDWGVTRARVLILGGRGDAGATALEGLLDRFPHLAGDRLDRLLQVVFDLQGGGYHDEALALLQRLARREGPGQRKRELLYWRAESREALDEPERAARLYMRSALLLDGRGGDQWGQTARYQAARMLADAGLVGDARRIFRQLLEVTESEERRTTLRRRLQKLGLSDAAADDLPAEAGPP